MSVKKFNTFMDNQDFLDDIFELVDKAYAHLSNGDKDVCDAYLKEARRKLENRLHSSTAKTLIEQEEYAKKWGRATTQ